MKTWKNSIYAALLLLICCCCNITPLRAQSLEGLADSVFRAIKTLKADSVTQYTPTFKQVEMTLDTLEFDKSSTFALTKQQTFRYSIRKQYKRMVKAARGEKVDLRKIELDRISTETGKTDKNVVYAYIDYYCKYKKKRVKITVVAIKFIDDWRIVDELGITFPEFK